MYKLRLCFKKLRAARYISHLDLMHVFQRALARAELPVWRTEGFNPHVYISIALPLSLGYGSICELADLAFLQDLPADEVAARLNAVLPDGIEVIRAYPFEQPVKLIAFAAYDITLSYPMPLGVGEVSVLNELFLAGEIISSRVTQKGEDTKDIKPHIKSCNIAENSGEIVISAVIASSPSLILNPEYVKNAAVKKLSIGEPLSADIIRTGFFKENMEYFE